MMTATQHWLESLSGDLAGVHLHAQGSSRCLLKFGARSRAQVRPFVVHMRWSVVCARVQW